MLDRPIDVDKEKGAENVTLEDQLKRGKFYQDYVIYIPLYMVQFVYPSDFTLSCHL